MNLFKSVVSFVVSFYPKTSKTIENKGWCAVEVSNLRFKPAPHKPLTPFIYNTPRHRLTWALL